MAVCSERHTRFFRLSLKLELEGIKLLAVNAILLIAHHPADAKPVLSPGLPFSTLQALEFASP